MSEINNVFLRLNSGAIYKILLSYKEFETKGYVWYPNYGVFRYSLETQIILLLINCGLYFFKIENWFIMCCI